MKTKNKLNLKILSIDIVVYLILLAAFILLTKTMFIYGNNGLNNKTMAYYLPLFLLVLGGFIFIMFIEYKRNGLNLKNFIILLAVFIGISNLIAVIAIPTNFVLPFEQKTISFTTTEKIYAAIYGISIAIIAIIYFVILPRNILSVKHISFLLLVLVLTSYVLIFSSFFTDKDIYKLIFTFNFDKIEQPMASIIGNKNLFGQTLFIGIASSILLSLINKKFRYILFSIPMLLILPFTSCKIALFITFITIFSYVIIKLIPIIKASKDNLIIFLFIIGFILIIGTILLVLTINSQTGILFKIKSFYEKFITQSKDTFNSRLEIWKCSFLLLGPVQVIFGCGSSLFNKALYFTYYYNPTKLEEPKITHSHNFIIECIGEGGIIYLLIVIALYAYLFYMCYKLITKKKEEAIFLIILLSSFIVWGMFEPIFILGNSTSILFSILIVFPIIGLYNCYIDNAAINIRKDIVKNNNKIKKLECKNLLQKIEYLHYKYAAKHISEMYENYHRL